MPLLATLALYQTPEPPRVESRSGTIIVHEGFESKVLDNRRRIWVYLPPNYEKGKERYPVMYLHDGQNVFDGMTSYIPNGEWRADETAEGLIRGGLLRPLILVAVDNMGAERANEYLPTRARNMGGQAYAYGRFLTDELKPFVDRTYRTRRGAMDTGLGGSSFGGVATLAVGLRRPDVFGRLAIVSPSVWWDDRVVLKLVDALPKPTGQRVWIDIGTSEGDAEHDARELRDAFLRKGWTLGRNLAYYEDKGAEHNERAWAGRFDALLLWLWK